MRAEKIVWFTGGVMFGLVAFCTALFVVTLSGIAKEVSSGHLELVGAMWKELWWILTSPVVAYFVLLWVRWTSEAVQKPEEYLRGKKLRAS